MLESSSLREWAGRHMGRPAWLIGGGPSLLRQDPAEMRGSVVFAVNQHIQACTKLGFPMADYWVFLDVDCPANHGHLFTSPPGAYPLPVKICELLPGAFLMGRGFEPGGDGRGKNFLPVAFAQTRFPTAKDERPSAKFSTLSGALSLAVIMGCNPITIVGLDLTKGHWYDQPGQDASADLGYDFQADYLHCVIQGYLAAGIRVTVKAASWLTTEPYVPEHMRPAPAGELVPIGGRP